MKVYSEYERCIGSTGILKGKGSNDSDDDDENNENDGGPGDVLSQENISAKGKSKTFSLK